MSTKMSTDMNITRPTTRVRAAPGGASSISFGDGGVTSSNQNEPVHQPRGAHGGASSISFGGGGVMSNNQTDLGLQHKGGVHGGASTISFGDDGIKSHVETVLPPPPPASSEPEPTPASAPASPVKTHKIESFASQGTIGLAIASPVAADVVTTTVAKALAAADLLNVVVTTVDNPAILPFVAKSMADTCSVVLAVAVLTGEYSNLTQTITSALVQSGSEKNVPILPAVVTPASLLELKTVVSSKASSWVKSVSTVLALLENEKLPQQPLSEVVSADVLKAAAAPKAVFTPETVDASALVEDLRTSLKSHGARGIVGISRKFRIIDDDKSGFLEFSEFTKAINEHAMHWSAEQIKSVFDNFDRNKDGKISYDEFIREVRGEVNDRRKQMVLEAFQILDKDKSGAIEVSDLVGVYDASKHPDVISGKRTEQDVLKEFLETFVDSDKDGKISFAEFLEYYTNVSASIDDDDYFELMMRNAWHISGGEGWCENTSCRRVLCTHADGHQTVQEIKNDLGISKTDTVAILANLKAQGIDDVTAIDNCTLVDSTTPATKPAPAAAAPANNNQPVAAGGRVGTGYNADGQVRSTTRRVAGGGASSIVLG